MSTFCGSKIQKHYLLSDKNTLQQIVRGTKEFTGLVSLSLQDQFVLSMVVQHQNHGYSGVVV